jgi:pSer/pThr/pTyr-binding forkhead associated (FHA) protein
LKIIGVIHTHPNSKTGTYINGQDVSTQSAFGYIFVIGWDGLHVSWYSKAEKKRVAMDVCTLASILSNNSIYYNLGVLK